MFVCVPHMCLVPEEKEALDLPEQESQMTVSCHVGAGNLNPGLLGEQRVLLTPQPSLQPQVQILSTVWICPVSKSVSPNPAIPSCANSCVQVFLSLTPPC